MKYFRILTVLTSVFATSAVMASNPKLCRELAIMLKSNEETRPPSAASSALRSFLKSKEFRLEFGSPSDSDLIENIGTTFGDPRVVVSTKAKKKIREAVAGELDRLKLKVPSAFEGNTVAGIATVRVSPNEVVLLSIRSFLDESSDLRRRDRADKEANHGGGAERIRLVHIYSTKGESIGAVLYSLTREGRNWIATQPSWVQLSSN